MVLSKLISRPFTLVLDGRSPVLALVAASMVIVVAGCTGATDKSPEMTKEQIAADHARAVKNIDNDPHLTAKDKELIKQHTGLSGPGATRGPSGPPAGK